MALAAQPVDVHRIFLSSGEDARPLRDLADSLVHEAVNASLVRLNVPVRLEIDRWERTSPSSVAEGTSVNAQFVERAMRSNRTVFLLIDRVGVGTREEFEAVVDRQDIQKSVFLFAPDTGPWPETPAGQFLLPYQERLYIDRAGPIDSSSATVALCRLFFYLALEALLPQSQAFNERR